MSVRVRLTRVGSKKNPIWRVVVADQRSPRDGRFIEAIGHYNPQTEPSTIRIDEERLQHWLDRGAQPTGTVKQLMKARAKSGGDTVPAATSAPVAAAAAEPAAASPVAESDEGGAAEPAPAESASAEGASADSEAASAGDPDAASPADPDAR
jgi:small subunit ribosomal protein S16